MSHFSVIVIGDNVEDQLQPYHEFECTGNRDQYVKEIDIIDEARTSYQNTKVTQLVNLEGAYFSPYDDQFYRDPTSEEKSKMGSMLGSGYSNGVSFTSKDWEDGGGYRAKIRFIPENMTEIEVPVSEIQDFSEWVTEEYGYNLLEETETPDLDGDDKYGYARVNSEGYVTSVINITNPNKKWDWYQIGGRWAGFFKFKPEFKQEHAQSIPNFSWGWDAESINEKSSGFVDSGLKKHIDFNAMRQDAANKASAKYDKMMLVFGDAPKAVSWAEIASDYISGKDNNRQKYLDLYNAQERVQKLKNSDVEGVIWEKSEDYNISKEEYIQNAWNRAISSYAIVYNGEWYQKGTMGWFGFSSDEMSQEEWNNKVTELIDSLTDDTRLTMVDCHI